MRKPKTLRRIRYTVRGSGPFPHDMLRYDNSQPATPEDHEWIRIADCTWIAANRFADGHRNTSPVELMLETYLGTHIGNHVIKDKLIPSHGRWTSFGWEVTEVYPFERIPFEEVPETYRKKLGYE